MAGVCGLAFHGAARLSGRRGALALSSIALLPLASFATAVVAQVRLRGLLIPLWEHDAVRLTACVVVLALAAAVLPVGPRRSTGHPRPARRPVTNRDCRPVPVISAAARPPTVVAVHRPAGARRGSPSPCTPVLAFLFDELSFAYSTTDARFGRSSRRSAACPRGRRIISRCRRPAGRRWWRCRRYSRRGRSLD